MFITLSTVIITNLLHFVSPSCSLWFFFQRINTKV